MIAIYLVVYEDNPREILSGWPCEVEAVAEIERLLKGLSGPEYYYKQNRLRTERVPFQVPTDFE